MKNFLKEAFTLIILSVIMATMMYGCICYATSPEVWYANTHDSKCESALNPEEDCGCYERFLEKEKENNKDNK